MISKIQNEKIKKKKKLNIHIFNEHSNRKGNEITIYSSNTIISNVLEKLAINLIKQNITEPLIFHIKNFNKNNINYSYNKIKNLLQKIREASLPNNDENLSDISNIIINFNNISKHEEGVPFCLAKGELFNLRYKNRTEKYIIFTSLYQLNISGDCDVFLLLNLQKCTYGLLSVIEYIWIY